MSKLPLVEGLLRYTSENNISFCMPGHKGGAGFLRTDYGKRLYESFIKADVTEVHGVDNLHNPEGIIKEAQELLKDFYGSRKSYFLVNGSTSGNLAMIFSIFNEGDKIIVERNCHRSVFNGIIMRKLKPIYIKNKINSRFNAPLSIDEEHFLSLLKEHSDAKGIILTYPNYYGIGCDLEFFIKEAKKYNMKVLIDSAHGAHFGVCSSLPKSAVRLGADMVVMSSHKTLPSLTQTAYLHVGEGIDINKVDFYVSSFLSTSPSYMLMASMDYGRFYLEDYGNEDYTELINITENYRKKINEIDNIHIIGKEDIEKENSIDTTRYVVNVKKGYSGYKLLEYLKTKGIEGEMSDGSNVVLIFSPFNKEEEFKKLYNVLKDCNFELIKKDNVEIINYNFKESKLQPYEVMERKKIKVKIEEAVDKICGNSIVPYPPGIPLVMMGEIIDIEAINVIKYYLKNNVTVLGIEEDKLIVLEV